eukprot:gene18106-19915_t
MATIRSIKPSIAEMDYGHRLIYEDANVNKDNRALASVRITEYPDSGNSNPEPVSDNAENFEDFLSPQFLKEVTGKSNLFDVKFLELQVDTSETSMGNLGHLLPHLVELKLSNSTVNSIRDIGTSLADLATLWLSRCGLVDLDGISCFYSLKELYLSYNEIDDVSSVSMLDCLEVIDLEGNNIDDIAQVEFLGLCSRLGNLTLSGNPVETCPHPDAREQDLKFYDYRSAVAKAVPQLRVLDDEAFIYDVIDGQRVIHAKSISKNSGDALLKEDLLIVQDCIKALPPIGEEEDLEQFQDIDSDGRPTSSAGRYRPGSGRITSAKNRPTSGRNRPLSSRNRPTSSRPRSSLASERPQTSYQRPDSTRPGSGRGIESPDNMDQDDSSDLTHGSKQVLCGNPVRALLARRKELKGTLRLKLGRESPDTGVDKFTPEHSYHHDDDNDDDNSSVNRLDVFEDLKRWRENFERNSLEISTPVKPESPSAYCGNESQSLSPTPPPGDPARVRSTVRRHVRKASAEPARPQTASDFRPQPRSGLPHNDARGVTAKSLDMMVDVENNKDVDSSLESLTKLQDSLLGPSNTTSITRPAQTSTVRPRQFRPGTAAASLKKAPRKHFIV